MVHYVKVFTNGKCVSCESVLILLEFKAEPIYRTCSFTDFLSVVVLLSTLLVTCVNFGAYLSIKRNMPYLWTWYDNIEMKIPNTNNGLEGKFSDLKSKLRNHNGLSKRHRMVFIDEYFKASFSSQRCPIGQR